MAGVLSAEEHRRIAETIRAAEATTSGEIFAVLANASDSYRFIPLLWAALAALIAGGLAAFLYPPLADALAGSAEWVGQVPDIRPEPPRLDARVLAGMQLIAFILLALLGSIPAVRPWLVPRAVLSHRAHRHALEQFLAHNLHATADRTGVLVFVSLAERYAAVIADEGIHRRVDQGVWDGIVANLIEEVREGRIADGFVAAIAACGRVLAAHVPPRVLEENEPPDKLVEV